jgi:pimeloyl-ACP methyl ester carboxylesterase
MADKRIFQLEEEGFLDDITDKVYMWLDKKANEGEFQEPSWKFKANVFLKILNNFATKFVPNVLTVEGKCYWHDGELFTCDVAYTGDWNPANFTATSIDALFARKDFVEALQSDIQNIEGNFDEVPSISFRSVVDNLEGLTTREFKNTDGQIEILSNRYIASDGSLVEENNSSVSDYIPISGGISDIEFCNRDIDGRLGVAFYDMDKHFISGVSAGNTGTAIASMWYYSDVIPTIPYNAMYMRVAGNSRLGHSIKFTCEEKIVPQPGVDYVIAEEISRNTLMSVEGIVDNEVEYSAVELNNYAIGTDGSSVSSGNSSISDYIKITGPIHEITYCNHTGNSLGVAFYDINKNFISGVDAGATGTLIQYSWYYSNVVPQIPEGAVYMRIAGNRALGHTLYLKIVQFSVESAKAVRPDVGYEFFSYNVDCSVDDTDDSLKTTSLQEEPVISTDNGLIMLPSGYSANGKPCQLVAFNHGAGGTVTANSASGWTSSSIKLLLKRGYAVLFVNGIPQAFRNTKYCNGAQTGAAAHMAGIIFLRSFKKAYDYVVGKYNVTREIVALGESMGGLAALNIALSGIVPVRAIAMDAPIIDLYRDAYFSGGWSSGTLGAGTFGIIAWMYQFRGCDFVNDTYTIDGTTRSMADLPSYPEDCEALWELNKDRVAAFNAYLTSNALVKNLDNEYVYDKNSDNCPDYYAKALRCPCKIWFGTDDNVNKLFIAKNFVSLLRNAGTPVWLREIPTSTHGVWNMTTTSVGVDCSIVEDGLTCGVCGVELSNWLDSIV